MYSGPIFYFTNPSPLLVNFTFVFKTNTGPLQKFYTYAMFGKVFTYPLRRKNEVLTNSLSLKRTIYERVGIHNNVN